MMDEMFDEVAVAILRRHPPGGGMRLGNVTQFFQRDQIITNGRRTDLEIGLFRDLLRADGFERLGIRAHHKTEDTFLSPGKFGEA